MDPYAILDRRPVRPAPATLAGRLHYEIGRWVDRTAVHYENWRIGRTPPDRLARRAARYRDAVTFLEQAGADRDPSRLFRAAEDVPEVERRPRRLFGLPACESLRWPSEVVAFYPKELGTRAADPTARNAHARAYLWRHGDPGRTTVVCVHGYRGGFPALDGRAFDVGRLFHRLGLDVTLAVLPYHGARTPEGTTSGIPFLNDPLRTLEGVAQGIADLRRLVRWLRSEGAGAVGVMGMSLGGYMAALLASLEPGLAFAVPVIPVASFADIFWERAGLRGEHDDARRAGIELELLRRVFSPHCPLSHRPLVPPERRMVIAGEGDRIVPPEHPEALAVHWGTDVQWFPGGHLAQLGRERALEGMIAFIGRN